MYAIGMGKTYVVCENVTVEERHLSSGLHMCAANGAAALA